MTMLTDLAAKIATDAHRGQFRWDGKTPYISHPAAVARSLIESGYSEEYVATGWLHDIIEDTSVTAQELLDEGIHSCVVDAVVLMTKKKSESYLDYILTVGQDPLARTVKAADIRHNMSCFDKPKGALYAKYELALYILEGLDY